jgi:hypothetical protein
MGKVQKPSNSERHTPESFHVYLQVNSYDKNKRAAENFYLRKIQKVGL